METYHERMFPNCDSLHMLSQLQGSVRMLPKKNIMTTLLKPTRAAKKALENLVISFQGFAPVVKAINRINPKIKTTVF